MTAESRPDWIVRSAPGENTDAMEMHFRVRASGLGFIEGPVVSEDRVTIVSLDNGHIYQIQDSQVDLLSAVGGAPNGAALDAAGNLYIAQNGGHAPGRIRRSQPGGLQLVRPDGSAQWLTLDPVFPTDLCFGPDGWVYLTDATRTPRYNDGRVWRYDPRSGQSELLWSVPWFPNGIAFGPDNKIYIASTGEGVIYVCDWKDGEVSFPEQFCRLRDGLPDGLAFDAAGNLLVAAVGTATSSGSIQIIDDVGSVQHVIHPGDSKHLTNLALRVDAPGLFVTDATRGDLLFSADYPMPGLALYPFRQAP